MLSGTVAAGSAISVSRTERRRSGSTLTACLTWTMPSTSSGVRPMTGNREWPVCAGRLDDVLRRVAPLEEVHVHARRADVRCGAVAEGDAAGDELGRLVVDGALLGRSEHERAQLESASRAERSSSCGSTPNDRTMALARPFSPRIGHAITCVKRRCGSWVNRAVACGIARAMFLGMSSPMSIVTTVLTISATA